MLVKIVNVRNLIDDLEIVFNCLRKHNMMLNPQKCVFVVEVGKFLGFMLSYRDIKANPNKCKSILEIKSPSTI